MTSSFNILSDDSLSCDQKVVRLQDLSDDLSQSLQRLSTFQRQVLTIQDTTTVESALDQMEVLLDEAIDYVYLRLLMRNDDGTMTVEREMCPEDLQADPAMIEWACRNRELAFIPVEDGDSEDAPKSMLLMPLAGHGDTLGILILWLDLDPSEFTQEQSTLLTMLARETASVIETHQYRHRIENARSAIADIIESIPHGLMAIDPDGTVATINSTMEFMLGVRRNDVVGQPYSKSLPQAVIALLSSMINKGGQDEQELALQIHGVDETLGISITPMHNVDDEDATRYVVVCRDLKLSREVAKLRELDAMKNDFLSLVSHELRTPLTSIMAYSETLLMEGMVDTEEERKEYLQIIHDEGARLSRLINDVLDLTKLEAGKMDYSYDEQDIHDVVSTALASSSSLSAQKNITVETKLSDSLPQIRLDSDRIMQVLMNLLSNAIKFTPEEGRITLKTVESPPFPGKTVPTVTVSVTDTGIGIAPEDLNKVFSKFEQIENIDHHSVGTGLGMPICKQIIEEGHGGEIWIESEVGVGTTVSFRIPVS